MAKNIFAGTAEETVRAVEKYYGGVADLTAKVKQKNFLKSLGKTQVFEGTLHVKKPGRLRLDYTNGQRIVIDGTDAWFYSKKSEQAIRRSFTDFDRANIPVAFLLGAASIAGGFAASSPDPAQPGVLELLPNKPGAAMKKLRVEADAGGRITRLTIFDKSGNTTEIELSDIRENTGVDDGLFVFSAPKGTEIIEQ